MQHKQRIMYVEGFMGRIKNKQIGNKKSGCFGLSVDVHQSISIVASVL